MRRPIYEARGLDPPAAGKILANKTARCEVALVPCRWPTRDLSDPPGGSGEAVIRCKLDLP